MTTTKIVPHIRWILRRDMAEVLAIENDSFEFPWSEEQFIRCLRQRNCIGIVAERDDRVVGFMIYELHAKRLHVLSLAVSAEFRGLGIGRALVEKLIEKLSLGRRDRFLLEVREGNLGAQQFFRRCGLKAISVIHDFYEDTKEDAYLFAYRLGQRQTNRPYEPSNRITERIAE